jgi:predicted TIM-barrel fold metal-dependent hydrolase
MTKIDAHIHFYGDHPDCLELLERLDVKLLNICVAEDSQGQWRSQARMYQKLTAAQPDRFAWCTSFDLPRFDDPDYVDQVIAGLAQDIEAGAIACKVWKNVGMEVRKPDGSFLMIDDPLFEPIFEYLTQADVTLLLHMAEPLACWQPLNENNPHYNYYRNHPEWHMANKPDYPSHQVLIAARDRVVARYPRLRIVGAHLASLEYDVAEIAKRLERYPNFAVDTSARLADLAYQDRATVYRFFSDYADQILFGTDIVRWESFAQMPAETRQAELAWSETRFQRDFAYYETDQLLTIGSRQVRGLGLPADVLDKFFWLNAQRWYPGI